MSRAGRGPEGGHGAAGAGAREPVLPLVDLRREFAEVGEACMAAVRRVAEQGVFVLGEELAAFEREFAAHCGARRCVGVGNGGDALYLALRALGIGPGDEVAMPGWTFMATLDAATRLGARPVLVDVDPAIHEPPAEAFRAALGPRTRALVAVHFYGQPADMPALRELCDTKGIALVEDVAQAHGAAVGGRRVGAWGDAACFSFYPSKNLGAWGDGGAVTTSRPEVAERIEVLRSYGSPRKYHHVEVAVNSRLDPLQAAVLRTKLPRLDAWNARRREAAARYRSLLPEGSGGGLQHPVEAPWGGHVYHVYATRHPRRDALAEHLRARGIETVVHYPTPPHLLPAYKHLGLGPGSLPATERAAREVLSLPMFPQLTAHDQERVVRAVQGFG